MSIQRAKAQGRRTRHVNARTRTTRALPFHLLTHPQRAVGTPVNPGCNTSEPQYGVSAALRRKYTGTELLGGAGLESKYSSCTYKVTRRGELLGKTDDIFTAMGFKIALSHHGFDDVEVS